MPPVDWKRLYFERALKRKHPRRPPHRLFKQLYPRLIEDAYARELDALVKFAKARVDARILPLLPEIKKHYGRERVDALDLAADDRKYYTAFVYADTKNVNVLHCTHKYLGVLDREGAIRVEKVIDHFFTRDRKLPVADFTKVDYFGPDKDIRVLRPDEFPEGDFSKLRGFLDSVRADDYGTYKPHVTHPTAKEVTGPFSHYVLLRSGEEHEGIYRSWPKTIKADADDEATLGDLADELAGVRIDINQKYTPEELQRLARLSGRSVEQWNSDQMNRQLQSIVEVDVLGSEPWLQREMGAYVVQNVQAIKSIPEEYLGQVEKLIAESARSGLRVEDLASELEDRYDVARSRAEFIARDQIGKFNGQLTELRQKDLGIDQYTWKTSGDSRVRDSHRENAVRDTGFGPGVYSWDDPPDTGHPGEDYQCRCGAEPVLAKFYEDDA